ncbi:MAG TPA: hypothetical protein PLY91_09325 [Methanoregulaceae archaeon]|jgi:hypothetical protein|nr:hypothetical protein [Methanoregulaceae archaeon]
MSDTILRRTEVEWVHLDRNGQVKDHGTDVSEELVDVGGDD